MPIRFDTGSRKQRLYFHAVPLSEDARKVHPEGIYGTYASVANMIKFGLRDAHPGQYSIRDRDTEKEVATAYAKVTDE